MYNLDAIIAVGNRVNSYEATQFRIWARGVLKEFIIKGFVMDDERLKGKNPFGDDYFEELLDRIREIRLSERRYYQKITDIGLLGNAVTCHGTNHRTCVLRILLMLNESPGFLAIEVSLSNRRDPYFFCQVNPRGEYPKAPRYVGVVGHGL